MSATENAAEDPKPELEGTSDVTYISDGFIFSICATLPSIVVLSFTSTIWCQSLPHLISIYD